MRDQQVERLLQPRCAEARSEDGKTAFVVVAAILGISITAERGLGKDAGDEKLRSSILGHWRYPASVRPGKIPGRTRAARSSPP
jgi:hypothetical protein